MLDNPLYILQRRAYLYKRAERNLRIKRDAKIRRLREKRAVAHVAIGAGAGALAGAGYGGYQGWRLGDAYADKWLGKDDGSWLQWLGKGGLRIGGGLVGALAGGLAGAGIGAGVAASPGTAIMMGIGTGQLAIQGHNSLNEHINNVKRDSSGNYSDLGRAKHMNELDNYYSKSRRNDFNNNFNFSPIATGHYSSSPTNYRRNNNSGYNTYTTPSYMSWQPSN